MITTVTNNTIVPGDGLTVLKFSTQWCGPCKLINPMIDEIAKQYETVSFNNIDADENKELAEQYGIRAVPTLFFIKDGQIVDKSVGAIMKSALVSKIENGLKSNNEEF